MRRPEEVMEELVKKWLDKAEADLESAEGLLTIKPHLLFPVAFHAQQAAEKFLKGFLTFHQIEFSKTHNIAELLVLVSKINPQLTAQLSDTTSLTIYGVETRYPGDIPEPTVDQAEEAVALAQKVRDAVKAALNAK